MKILLLGKNGQVGWELQRSLAPLGEIIALDRNGENELCGDLSDLDGLRKTIKSLSPDVIVNAAAYTAVDKAESETAQTMLINAEAPQIIAEEAKKLNALFVHYSTDYVFNGKGPNFWKENDNIEPVNAYGKSKAEGEARISGTGCRSLIFRTSWVYGFHGNNFIKKILQLAEEREKLTIINDQFGVPAGAELISDVTAHCIRSVTSKNVEPGGIYHLVPAGETTWFDLASYAIDIARNQGVNMNVKEILPVPSSEFKTAAVRPSNSRMDTTKLRNEFSLFLPEWKSGVKRMVEEFIWKKQ